MGDRLRDALNEGRIDLSEYDERLQQAFAAKTYGELDRLLDDLPGVTPAQHSQLATTTPTPTPAVPPGDQSAPTGPMSRKAVLTIWGGWLSASLITTGVWVASSLVSEYHVYFWPIWVILPFGAVCVARTFRYLAGDNSVLHSHDQRRAERQERRDRRRGR